MKVVPAPCFCFIFPPWPLAIGEKGKQWERALVLLQDQRARRSSWVYVFHCVCLDTCRYLDACMYLQLTYVLTVKMHLQFHFLAVSGVQCTELS